MVQAVMVGLIVLGVLLCEFGPGRLPVPGRMSSALGEGDLR